MIKIIKILKQTAAVFMIIVLSAGLFTGCTETETDINNSNKTNSNNNNSEKPANINYTETLKVYNAGEYMDMTAIADFEREYAIKIEYSEFESNEDMYSEISANPNEYDVLVPSDYMIDRLIKEDKLEKLDKTKVTNIANVAEEYLNPVYDPSNDYVAPYMAGTLGILYNKYHTTDTVDSWTALFDTKYNGKVLMLDSQRDSIGVILKMLGYSLNSSDDGELSQVKSKLQDMRHSFIYDGSEIIRDKMVAGEGVLGVVYSGDAKTAIDRNPDLAYVIPKEGSNKWVDGFVIVKNTKHLDAAQKFINFMCRPNIAVRNMTKTGYTSPIKGAWSEFGGNKIMFASDEELSRCEAFLYDADTAVKYDKLWVEVH